jgi:hypothetical protein
MPSSNSVTISDKSGTLRSVTYVDDSTHVTSGESYETPPTIKQSGPVFTITLKADRKGSSETADSFNSSSGGTAFEYAPSGGGGTPDKLNFWFSLLLNFSTAQGSASVQLNIGQGHYATTNNWWIGGAIVTSSVPSLNVPIGSGLTLVLPLSGNHESFEFGLGSIT